jgi:hypothetical protein
MVLQEYQAGYKLWDRVLRPAKVIVSTAPREEGNEENPPDQAPDDNAADEGIE